MHSDPSEVQARLSVEMLGMLYELTKSKRMFAMFKMFTNNHTNFVYGYFHSKLSYGCFT